MGGPEIVPGRRYLSRGQRRRVRHVVAIGPEHRPLNAFDARGQGVLFVEDGRQGRCALSSFKKWAAAEIPNA